MTKDPEYPELRNRLEGLGGALTVQELVDWAVQRGLALDAVTVTHTTVRYKSAETDAERERREQHEIEQRERAEKWERETLARLKAKYE